MQKTTFGCSHAVTHFALVHGRLQLQRLLVTSNKFQSPFLAWYNPVQSLLKPCSFPPMDSGVSKVTGSVYHNMDAPRTGRFVYDFYPHTYFDTPTPSPNSSSNFPPSPPTTPSPNSAHSSHLIDNIINDEVLSAVKDLHNVIPEPHSPFYRWFTLASSRPFVENLTGYQVIQTIYDAFMAIKYGTVTLDDICLNYEYLPHFNYSSAFPVPPPGNNPPPVPSPGNITSSQGIYRDDFFSNCIDMYWSSEHDSNDMHIIPNSAHNSEKASTRTTTAHQVSVIKHT